MTLHSACSASTRRRISLKVAAGALAILPLGVLIGALAPGAEARIGTSPGRPAAPAVVLLATSAPAGLPSPAEAAYPTGSPQPTSAHPPADSAIGNLTPARAEALAALLVTMAAVCVAIAWGLARRSRAARPVHGDAPLAMRAHRLLAADSGLPRRWGKVNGASGWAGPAADNWSGGIRWSSDAPDAPDAPGYGDRAAAQRSMNEAFANVARRTQALVARQLTVLDDLERDEEDPDVLTQLFLLDNLATRMRRNSDSLLVLAGTTTGRQHRESLPLADVGRTAASGIEQYDRIRLGLGADPLTLSHYVRPAAHLIAELLENATASSEPDTPVEVTSISSETTVEVSIIDVGLGMSAGELAAAQAKIDRARANADPDIALSETPHLGLRVVGQLSRILNAPVTLHSERGPGGSGTRAVVSFPATLFEVASAPEPPGTPGAFEAPGARGESTAEPYTIPLPPVTIPAGTQFPAYDSSWAPVEQPIAVGAESLPTRAPSPPAAPEPPWAPSMALGPADAEPSPAEPPSADFPAALAPADPRWAPADQEAPPPQPASPQAPSPEPAYPQVPSVDLLQRSWLDSGLDLDVPPDSEDSPGYEPTSISTNRADRLIVREPHQVEPQEWSPLGEPVDEREAQLVGERFAKFQAASRLGRHRKDADPAAAVDLAEPVDPAGPAE
ncbi:MAG: hypothetical protein LBQ06_03055, partial [Frankiaceae bacterium]|nr:hypothetical protein [Frankiaceae bacterium]